MAHNNRPQTSLPSAPSPTDLDTICAMTTALNIKNPYRKYPPCGVPCPEGSNTFHLALRREKWWQMLQEHAWKERVMLETMRIEDERKEKLRQMREKEKEEAEKQKEVVDAKVEPKKEMVHAEVEQKKQRKDSLVVGMKDVEYADKQRVGDGGGAAASAICDCSEEEKEEDEIRPQQIKDIKGRKPSLDKGKKLEDSYCLIRRSIERSAGKDVYE
ncbi:hypothetical protein E4T44_01323 [Aureobasidium sp. EXF-8845]|nr:hypothetical protein E4T44_01323 [Aureobasidium sp. EXF-8845]KAI4857359.1 hypothetical protein E4T45_01153 [Aureobasidium sp. EXF-8846]